MATSAALRSLFANAVFLATVSSWLLAQVIKTAIYIFSNKNIEMKELAEVATWRTGGMPSSHSALTCALAVSVGFAEGIYSTMFMVCAAFALVVLRDAVGVRRASGLQAKAINSLGRQLAEKTGGEFSPVKEIQGHTPQEVAMGALLGACVAMGFSLL